MQLSYGKRQSEQMDGWIGVSEECWKSSLETAMRVDFGVVVWRSNVIGYNSTTRGNSLDGKIQRPTPVCYVRIIVSSR